MFLDRRLTMSSQRKSSYNIIIQKGAGRFVFLHFFCPISLIYHLNSYICIVNTFVCDYEKSIFCIVNVLFLTNVFGVWE